MNLKLPYNAQAFIRIAISLLEVFLATSSSLTNKQKADIEAAIQASQKVLTDFGG